MRELLPGIQHWTAVHPKIHIEVSSYYLTHEHVLIDPLLPPAGIEVFDEQPPAHVILTNRHHYRDSGAFVERFGCTVWCSEAGMHEFTGGEQVKPFRFGDTLPGGALAIEIGSICPDETALFIPLAGGVIAVADGVVRMGDGPLGFVPEEYMGENAEAVKAGLRDAYRRLLSRDFDHLLLAHGLPWIGGGKQALAEFVGAPDD